MKHTRKIIAAAGLFALAPLVGCDQGVEDASAPDGATGTQTTPPPADTTQEPPPATEDPTTEGGGEIEDQSAGG